MKVLLTGATGYIGSVIAEKLLKGGHQVLGLARSDASAQTLKKQGVAPFRSDLGDTEALTAAARTVDGVIHTAFDIGSQDFAAANASEARAVEALLTGLQGGNKPLIFTSGTGVLGNTGDKIYDEETPIAPADNAVVKALQLRLSTEKSVLNATGVRGIVLRPPNVYGRGDGRVVFWLLRAAAQKLQAVPYALGTGDHQWTFVHVEDLADLFVLALEKAPGGQLFHTGAQSGLRTQDIASALSRGMGLGGKTIALDRADLAEAIGVPPVADYWASNSQTSGEKARRVLGWTPQHLDLLNELGQTSA